MLHFSSILTSTQLSGILLQTSYPLATGEQLFVLPSSSSSSSCSFASSPMCVLPDPGFASSRLHDPPSSSSAPDSQHVATEPGLAHSAPLASSLPYDRSDPLSWGGSDLLPGASTSTGDTPPLPTMLDPSGTEFADRFPGSSGDTSVLTPPLRPTLEPSVHLSRVFPLFGSPTGSSRPSSVGFEESKYASGGNVESFLPDMSAGGFRSAADLDPLCGCSLESSGSSSWLLASPHVPLPSSVWDSASVEVYSGLPSGSTVGIQSVLCSEATLGSGGLSLGQDLLSLSTVSQGASTDLPLSASAPLAAVTSFWLAHSDLQPSAPPLSPSASPFPPTPEEQTLDTGSGASGSAVLPDSQEGLDQEWDRIQVSGSGGSTSPRSTDTLPPTTTSEPTHNPRDDLDERSSAFYFESESGSAAEAGDAATAALPAVSAVSPWPSGTEGQSGSGQGESLYDNDTSSDFSISEHTEREEEEPVAGKRAPPPGSPMSSFGASGWVLKSQ